MKLTIKNKRKPMGCSVEAPYDHPSGYYVIDKGMDRAYNTKNVVHTIPRHISVY